VTFPRNVWEQLRNLTADELIAALRRDRWAIDSTRGSIRVYRHSDGRRVAIHYHPQKTYGAKLLRALLDDIGWTTADLRRLKLIK
jgi:predicted RNA binding protein YcfA (HicA-like mRNA interferase family)